jgi:hypothetical protein
MIDSESKPKVRKRTPSHASTKKHKNKKTYNRKEKGRKIDTRNKEFRHYLLLSMLIETYVREGNLKKG